MFKNYNGIKCLARMLKTLIKALKKTPEPLNPVILEPFFASKCAKNSYY